ncbi:MAG: DegV family protein [Dorea longicatena]
MKTAVMTDTNSGIMKAEADSMGIFLIPMPVIINDETHYEGIDLTETSFYESLTGGKNISTSQPSPGDLMDLWDDIFEQGYDEIIHIPMSSGLSASCSSAISLSADYEGKAYRLQTITGSLSHRENLSCMQKSLQKPENQQKEIKEILEAEAYNSSIYIAVDTLEFLKKGGRVTAAGAAPGSVLNIKPILTIQGGKLDAFAKTRGIKKCKQKMVEALKNDRETRFKDTDDRHILIGAAGSNLTEEEAAEWKQMLVDAFPNSYVYYDSLSFSIGCHIGPKGYGMGISVCSEDYDN